ncbi:MAG: multidrug ABC transporter ATP-binding protein [Spirochaetaceae bacterium 4572_7]|nr:MAG: multidrug ABC transporter ATP-binding protein [Spirochaetaceae bacterium 4572_7]
MKKEDMKKMGPKMGPKMGFGHGRNMGSGEKAKNFKGTIGRLLGYISAYKGRLLIVSVFAIISTVSMIIGPKLMGKATTRLFEGVMNSVRGTGEVDFSYIKQILLWTLFLYILSSIFSYIMGWVMTSVSMDITYKLRRDISLKMNKIPISYYDKTSHGQILSIITNDIDTVNQTLSQSLTQIVTSLFSVIGVIVMMLSINWIMTLAALLTLPLSMLAVKSIIKQSQKYFKIQQKSLGNANAHIEEMYGAHPVMKAFNGEEDSIRKFEKHNDKLYESAWKSQFLSGMMMPIMTFVGNLGYVIITILGGYLAVRKSITIGDIQAFIQYVRSFNKPISQIANISNILQQTAAAAERVFEFLDEKQEIEEVKTPVVLDKATGLVEFKNVHFGYHKDTPIIKNFSAVANPGAKIAIVGPTGAGKTTVVKLLMRFYDIDSGTILIDGKNIRDFKRSDLRGNFAMVLQDTWLYNESILENIRYGRPDATDEEVFLAAKTAHADHFIQTQPGGYNMILNEESSNISQGQKQLLTIARAILADPKILILDEATSSVDTRTETLIQRAMDNLMSGRTSFVIAHRLSTIKDANTILVMKDGDIIEQGDHETLLNCNGFYSELYQSQFDRPVIAS